MEDETVSPSPGSAGARSDALADGGEELDAAREEIWKRGHEAWPGVSLEPAALAAYLDRRAPPGAHLAAWLRGLRPADVFLACACAQGVPAAIRAFEAAYLARLPSYLRALRPTPETVAETKQELLEKLFVGSEGRPAKIEQYACRGPLEGWVRLVALGTAADLVSSEKARRPREQEHDEIARGVAPDGDPELELMKASYRGEFEAAFREALASLSHRERNLLRFTFIDHLTPARIGAIHGVHRTTAMRWIEAAQGEVLARTRTRLMERLRLSPGECDDVLALVRSRIHVTLGSLLRTAS